MYKIAPTFRFAMRLVAISATVLMLGVALFAATIPYLIEGRTVRDSLIRSLSAWSGGSVIVTGPLRIVSLATLSIKADGVLFTATPRLSPIVKAEAKSVTAFAKISSLLRGRLEFKTMEVESPKVFLQRGVNRPPLPVFGLETAGIAIAVSERSLFERLDLRDCTFVAAGGDRRPYKRLHAAHVRLDKGVAMKGSNPPETSFYVKDNGFDVWFRGTLDAARETASGYFSIAVSSGHPVADEITASIAPWERGHGVSISGDFNWLGSRAALDAAKLTFDGHRAKGSLVLAIRHGRGLLQGTLAYDKLDWTQGSGNLDTNTGVDLEPLRSLQSAYAGPGRNLDLDMRISAERFPIGASEAGPVAFSLTSRNGQFSIDIAELVLFGGRLTGRLDYDNAHPRLLALNASGVRLDAASLSSALGLPFAVNGQANVRVRLDVPFGEKPLAEEMRSSTGNFTIDFPSGGTLDGDVSRELSAAFEHHNLLWGLGSSSFSFTSANLEGSASDSGVSLKIDGEHEGGRIDGALKISEPDHTVNGNLAAIVAEDAEQSSSEAGPATESAPPARIKLSGTVAALNFSPLGKASLSN